MTYGVVIPKDEELRDVRQTDLTTEILFAIQHEAQTWRQRAIIQRILDREADVILRPAARAMEAAGVELRDEERKARAAAIGHFQGIKENGEELQALIEKMTPSDRDGIQFRKGWKGGHAAGMKEGLAVGKREGYTEGKRAGVLLGREEGERTGMEKGRAAARQESQAAAYKQGHDDGYKAAREKYGRASMNGAANLRCEVCNQITRVDSVVCRNC